ncbi:MAG: hypothetical protein AB7D02_00370 [Candidatus Paceibacterota bacterium]
MIAKIKKFVKKHKEYFLLSIFSFLIFSFGFSLGIIYGGQFFKRPPIIIEKDLLWQEKDFNNFSENKTEGQKLYVASSRGKYYYPLDCPLANNLSEKNKIYFSSKEEAEAKGYLYNEKCDQY